MEPPTHFCLIRHGETAWNAERRYQGQLDIDLNALGEAQARALRLPLAGHDFAAIYASDLTRAWRTAQLATGDGARAVLPAPTLRERHYGVFQGMTVAEASTALPHAHRQYLTRALDYDFETGESLREFAARIDHEMAVLAARHAGANVLVFTHGGVLDVIYRRVLGRDLGSARDFSIPNAGINWLRCDSNGWSLEQWGERSHLAALDRALDEVSA